MKNAAVKPGKNKSSRTDPQQAGKRIQWVRDMEVRRSSCVPERLGKLPGNTQPGLSAIPKVAAYCKVKSLYVSQIFIVE